MGFRESGPLALKDTAYFSKGIIILDSVIINPNNNKYHFKNTDTALIAKVTVIIGHSTHSTVYPLMYIKDNVPQYLNDTLFEHDLVVRFNKVVDGKKIQLGVKESSRLVSFVALKALEFPQINILWIGTIIMLIGFVMSILSRRRQLRLSKD